MIVARPDPRLYDAPRYQVRLADASGQTSLRFWGKTVSFFDPTEFSREELLARWKIDWRDRDPQEALRDLLANAFYDRALSVEAWLDGRWAPASAWAQRRKPGRPADENLDAITGQMRMMIMQAPKRPGVGEMVWHLMKHRGRSGAETLKALKDHLGEQHVYPADLTSHRRNGRQREKEGRPCRFCS